MPGAGWAQIIAVVGIHELTINKQDYTKTPGEIPTFLGFKPEDPAVRPCSAPVDRPPLSPAHSRAHVVTPTLSSGGGRWR